MRRARAAIILFTMQVYAELALIENFCMDFTLLFAAKTVSKTPSSVKRLCVAAAMGACFAVVYPLIKMPAALGVAVKLISGLALCLIGGRVKPLKAYLKFTAAFFIFSALLAGGLIGLFALTGWEALEGGGFLISSVPIGIPLFGALLIILGAKNLAARLSKNCKNNVICRIYAGQLQAEVSGFFDSGNKVFSRGEPVCVFPKSALEKILTAVRINENVKIHTVAGSKIMEVFTADELEIDFGGKKQNFKKVKIGVSPQPIARAVLHCDLLENANV